jgi:hypothetical protein
MKNQTARRNFIKSMVFAPALTSFDLYRTKKVPKTLKRYF